MSDSSLSGNTADGVLADPSTVALSSDTVTQNALGLATSGAGSWSTAPPTRCFGNKVNGSPTSRSARHSSRRRPGASPRSRPVPLSRARDASTRPGSLRARPTHPSRCKSLACRLLHADARSTIAACPGGCFRGWFPWWWGPCGDASGVPEEPSARPRARALALLEVLSTARRERRSGQPRFPYARDNGPVGDCLLAGHLASG